MKYQKEIETFQALRYEQDGGKCVVQGPLADQRNTQSEKMFTVATDRVYLTLGTPVVCHGLETSDLNGKFGDLRSFDAENDSYKVHFEDSNIEPQLIERKNLQILIDLPEEIHEQSDRKYVRVFGVFGGSSSLYLVNDESHSKRLQQDPQWASANIAEDPTRIASPALVYSVFRGRLKLSLRCVPPALGHDSFHFRLRVVTEIHQ